MLEQTQCDLMSLTQLKKLAEDQQKLLNEKQSGLREKENQLKILYKKYQDQVDTENRLRKTKVVLKQQEERLRHLRELRGLVEQEKTRSDVLSIDLDSVKKLLQSKKDELRKVTDKVDILSHHLSRFTQQKDEIRALELSASRPAATPEQRQAACSANYEFSPWPDDGTEISQLIAAKQCQLHEVRASLNDVNARLSRTSYQRNSQKRIPARENGSRNSDGINSQPNGILQRLTPVENGSALPNGTAAKHAKTVLRPVHKPKVVSEKKPALTVRSVETAAHLPDKIRLHDVDMPKPNGAKTQRDVPGLRKASTMPSNDASVPQLAEKNEAVESKPLHELQPANQNDADISSKAAVDAAKLHGDEPDAVSNFSYAYDDAVDETDQRLPAERIPILSVSPSNNGSHSSRGETPVKTRLLAEQRGQAEKLPSSTEASTVSSSSTDVSVAPSSSSLSSTVHGGGDEADTEEAKEEQMTPSKLVRRVSFDPLALLLDAALEGELELVRKTAGQVADPSAPNDEGITALHNAICTGHFDVVKFLVNFGCDVNVQDADGWSPLHCAASCTHVEMLKLLVEHGACVFATTFTDNETPSQKCEEGEDGYEASFKYLTEIESSLGHANDAVVYPAYDFEAHNEDELSFRRGDKIKVLHRDGSKAEREWWWAKVIGNVSQQQSPADATTEDKENSSPSSVTTPREGFVPRNMLSLHPVVRAQKSQNHRRS